jgi:hypothetical protein
MTILQWAYNLIILRDVHGCTRQLLWIPCAGLLLMRKYRADYGDQKAGYRPASSDDQEMTLNNDSAKNPIIKQYPDL